MIEKLYTAKEKDPAIAIILTAAVFWADIISPPWYDAWLLYLIPLFFMFRSAKRPYLLSLLVTVLIIAGLFLHPDVPFKHSLADRATGILAGWGVSALLMQLKHLHDRLLQSYEERYRSLSENMLEGFAYCQMLYEAGRPHDFIYRHVNPSFGTLTGLQGVVGKKVTELIPGIRENYPEIFETYGRVALTGRPEKFETFLEPLNAWLAVSAFSTEKEHFIAVFENITDRKKAEEELRSLTLTDELTGLYNRRGFTTFIEKLGKIAKRQKRGLYMLYGDLDGLKEINDTWGHSEGDAALKDMANILSSTYRESDVIARIGGDEFVVIPVGANAEESRVAIGRMERNIDAHNSKMSKGYKLSLSWGLSYYDPANPPSAEELLKLADKAMYEKKSSRRRPHG